jgi:hypothetical protein
LSNSLPAQVNLLKFSKKYVCKYKKLIIGAILRSFFWPVSIARGVVMFGYNESVICKYIKKSALENISFTQGVEPLTREY